MKLIRFVLLLVGLTLACALPAAISDTSEGGEETRLPSLSGAGSKGNTFYVSPYGNDQDPGSREAPWSSPGFASRQLQPGDTLVILPGRYLLSEYDADILMPPSGTEAAWITIQGEPGGSRPVLVGRDNLAAAIILNGVQYVAIKHLEITHDAETTGERRFFRDGIQILDQPSRHIVLEDLYIHHLDEFGLNVQDVEDLTIRNCRIEYAGMGAFGGPEGQKGGLQNVRILKSILSYSGHYYQGGDDARRVYDRPDGFGIEASQGPVLIEDTIAAHNYGDGLDSKAANTLIRRSIVANNSCDGVKLWGDNSRVENTLIYGRGDGNREATPWSAIVIHTQIRKARFELINISVDDYVGNNYLMHVQYDQPDIPVQLTIRNSIFRAEGPNTPIFFAPGTILRMEYNLFFFPNDERVIVMGNQDYSIQQLASLGVGNRYGDPMFVRPAWGEDGDYHLQAGSPAINAGSDVEAPKEDLEGKLRQAPIDLGAYETP